DQLIQRGPVMDTNDVSNVLGSTHIVEVETKEQADVFAFEEPFYKNGVFKDVRMMGFELELGRTQFVFESNPDWPRFFVYCPARTAGESKRKELRDEHHAYCKDFDENFVCRGAILAEDGSWNGQVFFIEAKDVSVVEGFLEDEPYNAAGLYAETQINRWTMGGPRNLNAGGALDK
ncbi:MAG: YciI family protein, partial [Rhodospirillaceae bacterium]